MMCLFNLWCFFYRLRSLEDKKIQFSPLNLFLFLKNFFHLLYLSIYNILLIILNKLKMTETFQQQINFII